MIDIIKAALIVVLAVVMLRSISVAFRLITGDRSAYEHNRARTGTLKQTLLGQVPTEFDGRRDYRVAAGIAVDRRTNTWIEQGRLSSEAIEATLRPST